MSPLVIILVILLLFGGSFSWHAGWGPAPTGGIGLVVLVLIVLLLMGRI